MKIEANGRSYEILTDANTTLPEGWRSVPEDHADSCIVRGRIKGDQITAREINCLGLREQKMEIPAGTAVGNLLHKTTPVYPPLAKAARVSGMVVLHATISKTGSIENLQVVSGETMLQQAALDAVKSWTYKPFLVKGQPAEVETTVNIIFTLGGPDEAGDDADTVWRMNALATGPDPILPVAHSSHSGALYMSTYGTVSAKFLVLNKDMSEYLLALGQFQIEAARGTGRTPRTIFCVGGAEVSAQDFVNSAAGNEVTVFYLKAVWRDGAEEERLMKVSDETALPAPVFGDEGPDREQANRLYQSCE
jgi:TonB family protein